MRALLAAVLGSLVWLAAGTAAGDDTADKPVAQELLARGNQLSERGDYLAALDAFRAAYARYPSPRLLINIGTVLRQLGRNVEAAEAYEAYLRDPRAEPGRKADLMLILGRIDAVVSRLRVEVSDPAAAVRLDGKLIDGAGPSIRVAPGEHTVVATREGLPPALRTLRLAPREEQVVRLTLEPAEARAIAPRPVSTAPRTAAFVVGGAGIAGLVAGVVLAVLAKKRSDLADRYCLALVDCTQPGLDLAAMAKTESNASTASFVLGGAAVAAGIALLLTAPSPAAAPRAPPVAVTGTF